MPEATLKSFADHGDIGEMLPVDAHASNDVVARFAKASIDADAVAAQLQREGAESFVKSWNELIACIAAKGEKLKRAG
jgi:transaldolase